MKPWEAGRRQIDRCEVAFNESLNILVHSCETVSEKEGKTSGSNS